MSLHEEATVGSGRDDSPATRKAEERRKRLRAALRANLRRRKEQARQREDRSAGKAGKPQQEE